MNEPSEHSALTEKTPPSSTSKDVAEPHTAGIALTLLVAGTFFMEILDGTVITPAVPHIARGFGVAPVDLNIGVSAYMLALGVFIPVSGWAADRFGTRRVFSLAIAIFTFASLLCGLTHSLATFVAARLLQGIGGAMMVPVGRLLVLRVTPKNQLINAIATLTWPGLVAPVLGPPLGGFIVDHASWRWIFYLNLPLGLLAFATARKLVPSGALRTNWKFDWRGFALTGSALACLLWSAETPARAHTSWLTGLAAGVIGVTLLAAGIHHLRHAKAPMFDLSSLKVPTFAVTIWGGSLFRMGINAIPFLLPLMFQIGFGFSAFQAGATLMAVFAGNLAMKPFTTPILRRFGFRPTLIVNGFLNALCIAACAALAPGTSMAVIWAVLFAGGLTRSMQFTALNTLAFADIPAPHMNSANTLFSTIFQLAVGLGISLGAIALRGMQALTAATPHEPATPFRLAFLIVALVTLIGAWDSFKLSPTAGRHVSARPSPK